MGSRSIDGATTGSYPRTGPGTGNDPHGDKYPDCEDGIEQEASTVGASVLFGLAEQVGEYSSAQGTDLADHATGDRGSKWPAKRDKLEGCPIARAERGKAEHEEQGGGDEWRRRHQAEESRDGDEEDYGEGGNSAHAIREPAS